MVCGLPDSNCYSVIDKGGSYSGNKDAVNVGGKTYDCMVWLDAYNKADFSGWPELQKTLGSLTSWLGRLRRSNNCRNVNYAYEKPWCFYESGNTIFNATCNIPKCNGAKKLKIQIITNRNYPKYT